MSNLSGTSILTTAYTTLSALCFPLCALQHARAKSSVRTSGPPGKFDMEFPCQILKIMRLTWNFHVKPIRNRFDMGDMEIFDMELHVKSFIPELDSFDMEFHVKRALETTCKF